MRTLADLENELRSVAKGERGPSPAPDVSQVDPIAVLTPVNRRLLRLLADHDPDSVSALAKLAGMAQPNISRALQDLAAAGYVRFKREGRAVRPEIAARYVRLDVLGGKVSRLVARTGEPCPESGLWVPDDDATHVVPVAIGSRMPPIAGRSVTWSLKECA